ncbi:hypothetical protein SAMD00019534_037320 [Acytostelium subglobosum LB1]|uniref:hypothetical protein n=1 Tax=Acytostelium subglobosum LB1 TaxID=1410327 RepID=UPI00064513D5|nr:hypothetical protein SAMD00019534_037320 [Acytostelium subglobosum LB1]GAM20557.1 hypothetical protein SAMD00019534_037320 [Acytostelium subglobosum LB1]|eukprot:XP_012760078.1 hypothetical protein SAMD00019534_037320 [Acytostelium subglobosum LB1]
MDQQQQQQQNNNNNNNNRPSVTLPSLDQIEHVLQTLFNPTNSVAGVDVSHIQNEANRWLLDLQNHQQIVGVCLELIKTGRPFFSQFYGLQTLYTKIHQDWESRWTDELRLAMKSAVFSRFLGVVNETPAPTPVILSKLASVVAAVITHSVPRLWDHPVSDLLQLIATNNELLRRGAIDILTLMPQEFNNVVLSNGRRTSIREYYVQQSESVTHVLSSLIEKDPSHPNNAQLLTCFRQWIFHSNAKSMAKSNIVKNLFQVLDNQTMLVQGMSLIGDLVNFHTYLAPLSERQPIAGSKEMHSDDHINFEQLITPIIHKLVSLKPIYDQSIKDQSSGVCRGFAEILSQIVECYTPIIMDISRKESQQVLTFLVEVCSHADREMSELTFDAWSYLADHVNDVGDDQTRESYQQIYAKLLQILIQRSSYPTSDEAYSTDLMDDISNYRNNVCDIITACFETIQEEEFVQYIHNLAKSDCKTWQSYEVIFYVFRCIHQDIMDDNVNASSLIAMSLTLPTHPILSNTILLMLEDYGDYIYERSELLGPVFQYIITMVQQEVVRSVALRTLYYFCQKYGDRLYENTESSLILLEGTFNLLKSEDQKNFVESILLLSSYITEDAQAKVVFQRLLLPIIVNLNATLNRSDIQPLEKSALLVERLSVLESGLKIPDEYFHIFKDFANNTLPLCKTAHDFSIKHSDKESLEAVWKVLWKILMEMSKETVFNVDEFINYLLADLEAMHTLTSSAYGTIDLLLNNFGDNTNYLPRLSNLINVLANKSLPIISKNNNESIAVISKFYRVMTKTLEKCPSVFYNSPNVVSIIERSIISILNIEKESVTSILEFLEQLYIKSVPHESLVRNYSPHIIANLFAAIVNDSTKQLTFYFSKLLFDWITKYLSDATNKTVLETIANARWLPKDTPANERERLSGLILSNTTNIAKFKSLIVDICEVCNNQQTWDVFLSYELDAPAKKK